MRQHPPFPDRYWLKFSHQPVTIEPFNPYATQVAQQYQEQLQQLLEDIPILHIYHRGSTALQIAGKGDIEIGVIPQDDFWFDAIIHLTNHFSGLGNLDDEYARFNDQLDGFDIEIILMRGYTATLDKALHKYLRMNPALLKEYEQLKQTHCHSQREYNQHKDQFFRRVTQLIPE